MYECLDCDYEFNPLTIRYTGRDTCPKCSSVNLDKTRSSLLIEYLRSVREIKPKYFIYENVKSIIGKKFKDAFNMFNTELQEYGYNTYHQVLNAKDYGIPQNRERIFVIGIRKDIDDGTFEFPKGFDNGLRLKDFLEYEVEEKYYINKPYKLLNNNNNNSACRQVAKVKLKGHDYLKKAYDINCCSPTLPTGTGGNHESKILEVGYFPYPNSDKKHQSNTFYSKDGLSQTLDTCQGGNRQMKIYENGQIRKLTPREYFRLQGFTDNDFDKAKQALINTHYNGNDRTNSQMYKQAGNSIVVDVLVHIYKNLFKDYIEEQI